MNNTTTQKVTFWKFLEDPTVEIPIIQRDYAQGRKGKEELRKKFLTDLKFSLDNNTELKLDFVYGSKENDRLNPLDGQQRLTTLWLMHWYIAYKAGELTDKAIVDRFKKFTYETRVSSREFCEHLSEFSTEMSKEFQGTISDFIQQQTWFYSAWKQDPTIQAMLRMLSGTPNKGKDGNEIIDGLEELFKECKDYEEVWTKLTEDNCPIVFYYLDLLGLNLSDDLYIKMNARGEQLTSFENFKADLVGYIKRQSESTVSVEDEKKWKGFLNPTEGIPIKMDTTWTDIFWKNKTEDGKIDEIYFAFLNRFFLNEFICKKKKDYVAAEIIAGDPIFKLLYGDKSDDSQILYQSFEKYKDCITIETLTSLKNTLDNFADFVKGEQLDEIDKLFLPTWDDTLDFSFIPKYRDKSITTLTQPQRVVFYAICKYFEKGKYDEPSFRQWMRVIWNLVENGNINTIDSMVANIRLINELSKYSHKIYEFLAKDEINSDTNKEQLREEIKKAKKISENNLWEEKIITAEKNKILKGKIWVLFQNEDSTELPTFNERLSLLQNIQDSEDAWFLQKILISYSGRLTKKVNLSMPNLKILLTKDLSLSFKSIPSTNPALINMEMTENWQKDIATTPLLDHSRGKILSPDKERFVLWGTDGCKWKSFGNDIYGNVILANPRNAILSALYEKVEKGKTLSEGKITSSQKIDGCDFFWGWDINFKYKLCGQEYFFRWQSSDQIDMYERNDYKQLLAHFTYAAQSLIDEMNHCIETYNQLQTQSNASKS